MKRFLFFTVIISFLFATNSFAQEINWANWAPLESKDGIDLQYRFGYYINYEGREKTELQIKAYNTRNKMVMVNFDRVLFSTGKKTYGGHLFDANEDSYTFTFRTDGTADKFETEWKVDYYK